VAAVATAVGAGNADDDHQSLEAGLHMDNDALASLNVSLADPTALYATVAVEVLDCSVVIRGDQGVPYGFAILADLVLHVQEGEEDRRAAEASCLGQAAAAAAAVAAIRVPVRTGATGVASRDGAGEDRGCSDEEACWREDRAMRADKDDRDRKELVPPNTIGGQDTAVHIQAEAPHGEGEVVRTQDDALASESRQIGSTQSCSIRGTDPSGDVCGQVTDLELGSSTRGPRGASSNKRLDGDAGQW